MRFQNPGFIFEPCARDGELDGDEESDEPDMEDLDPSVNFRICMGIYGLCGP